MHLDLLTVGNLALLLGLSFFLGLSFEGFYWQSARSRPGGIRTFPIIALCGAFLFTIESHFAAPFCVGLAVLGLWLFPYYQAEVAHVGGANVESDGIMVPLCNIVAYVLGPITLTQSPWVAFGLTVTTVLLLRAKDRLHELANRIPSGEIITLAQFLVLIGVVLPLLPNEPVTDLTKITPFQVWLAVVVVSSLSYGSYLLQKVLSAQGSVFLTSILGGLYSSTATTIVLARRLKQDPEDGGEFRSGIVLATALMYLRLGVVIAIFNVPLAMALAPRLVVLAFAGGVMSAACLWWRGRAKSQSPHEVPTPSNPLELKAGMIFAVLFVVISVVSAWVTAHFGHVGIYWLAAIVGVTDIDPFVLSVAQGSVAGLDKLSTATAILLAASSNNLLKGVYSMAFAGFRNSVGVVVSLLILSAIGCALAIVK